MSRKLCHLCGKPLKEVSLRVFDRTYHTGCKGKIESRVGKILNDLRELLWPKEEEKLREEMK